jgi:hypothetical protein
MDKILVEIYIPAAEKSYDVYIPLKSKMYEVVKLLAATFSELIEACHISAEEIVICYKNTGRVLDINMSAKELGLYNGSKLMLI